ncbi:ComEC/Rec2 family competence protein [Roseinatronobacter sp.]|uniref:ComEC/Rec2 family competence protein n=1 Tax=Roseinatronobacter sp. TaxID=1945755 RepID=UPI0025F69E97|nr:ComEC/Rec2 family competence protein [Rhodobaca sp.]
MRVLTFSFPRPAQLPAALINAIAEQRGHLFLFVPVLLAIGIGIYFALPREPTPPEWAGTAAVVAGFVLLLRRIPEEIAPLVLIVALIAVGMLAAGLRAALVSAPVLQYRYFGAIEGRIVQIDRSATDALRLTLDQVVLERLSHSRTPVKVRISLHGDQGFFTPEPGLRVATTGHLGPPPAPSEPGGFDFRRLAWFERLGAVGYTRVPVLALAPADQSAAGLRIHRLRMKISDAVQAHLPGDTGGFAAAILTGDRSGIAQARMEDLRRSNLAHLLAISGLHMGLLTGFVFGLLRLVMAMVPAFALRAPTRKLAALGALAAGGFYLILSGGNVATQRAYIMVGVMLVAVLLDRRAISLRSVAMAATLILLLRPEALVQAGFQMSFAATVALVAVFRWLAGERGWRGRIPRWVWPVISVVICSLVAGIATAPIAAASFNRIAEYGLIANLLAVPLMGLVVMPAAVLAALLAPFGLEWVGLRLMGPAIDWILQVSAFVSGLDGAVLPIVQPAPGVIPAMALGALWLILWQGRARWAGVLVMTLALLGWGETPRPTLLIAREAEVVGLMHNGTRRLSRARAGSFTAESWLRADGDRATQAEAFARSGFDPRETLVHLHGAGFDVVHLAGQQGLAQLESVCLPGRIVVVTQDPDARQGPCRIISPSDLRQSGALALSYRGAVLTTISVAQASGHRRWTAP